MGMLSGALSFVRYHVIGQEPDPFWSTIDERVRAFSFRETESGAEEVSMGWVGLDSMLDTEFAYANYAAGDYLTFSFRTDRKSIPGALVKKHVLEAERKLKADSGRKRISRQEMVEVRERVKMSLMSQALAVPSTHDVCWCISQKWLIFTGVSSKIRTEFEDYFKRCFELELVPFFPWDATNLPEKLAERLSVLEPEIFTG